METTKRHYFVVFKYFLTPSADLGTYIYAGSQLNMELANMDVKNISYTFFKLLLEGIAGVFSLGALVKNHSLPEVNNSEAIREDWAAIAADYNISIKKMDMGKYDGYKKTKEKKNGHTS